MLRGATGGCTVGTAGGPGVLAGAVVSASARLRLLSSTIKATSVATVVISSYRCVGASKMMGMGVPFVASRAVGVPSAFRVV